MLGSRRGGGRNNGENLRSLSGASERNGRKTYIRAPVYVNPGFDAALARAKADPTWRSYEVLCSGHDVMVDMPERLTEILPEVA